MEAETITTMAKHIIDTTYETSASSDVGNKKTNPGYAGGRFIWKWRTRSKWASTNIWGVGLPCLQEEYSKDFVDKGALDIEVKKERMELNRE